MLSSHTCQTAPQQNFLPVFCTASGLLHCISSYDSVDGITREQRVTADQELLMMVSPLLLCGCCVSVVFIT